MTTRVWDVAAASVLGSVHVRERLPNQDSFRTWAEADAVVVTVADGHGHRDHFRSEVGADLATRCALDTLRAALPRCTDAEAARAVLDHVAADVVEAWRAAVTSHLEAAPYDDDEAARVTGPLRPYGSTLLATAATGDVLVALQIGDGDTVFVDSDGDAFRPLPEDGSLDGVHTASLCQPDPLASFRYAAVDLADHDVALAYVCTDGFSTARVDTAGWWQQTGTELVGFVRGHGVAWVADQLPTWLDDPARIGGDDTTLALLSRATSTS